jgi:hypothetical protein
MSLLKPYTLPLAAILIGACQQSQPPVRLTGNETFREGDLVFRCGRGAESRIVTTASNGTYSHVGILCYDSLNASWIVVHAVPGEAPAGQREWVKSESLSAFFSHSRASRGAWAQVDCPDSTATSAARYALQKARQAVEFDHDYSLTDSSRLYCTELIFHSYLQQGIDITQGHRHHPPRIFCKDTAVIYPDDITLLRSITPL